ncbi:MAG: GNAT family N-acetyltransferase [Bacteroidetes bacterium]|nr:MAG: GNAT family N-acetyltransferase [Bacteroidota bacterium]
MKNVISIRPATATDCTTIAALGKQTFVETYGEVSPKESLDQYLKAKFSPEKIAEELSNPDERFFIAFVDEMPVGFTKLRYDRIPKNLSNKKAIELERIYVLREHQGSSVGKELMNRCKEIAKSEKFDLVWLQVWQDNHRAIQFYQKSGFVIYDTAIFNFADIKHKDYLMRFDLYL